MISDELDEMSPNKFFWSVASGTVSNVIAAWLVFKFLEKKGARQEIGCTKNERDDLNNWADKLPEENDERLSKRAEEHQ